MTTFVPESTFQTEDPTRPVHQPQSQIHHQQPLQLQQHDYNQYNNNLSNQSHSVNGQFNNYITDSTSAYTKSTFTSHITSHFPKLEPKLENVYENAYSNQMTGYSNNSAYTAVHGVNNYPTSNSAYQYCNQTNNTNDVNFQQQLQATARSPHSAGYYYEKSSNFMGCSSSSWSNRPG